MLYAFVMLFYVIIAACVIVVVVLVRLCIAGGQAYQRLTPLEAASGPQIVSKIPTTGQ